MICTYTCTYSYHLKLVTIKDAAMQYVTKYVNMVILLALVSNCLWSLCAPGSSNTAQAFISLHILYTVAHILWLKHQIR